MKTVNTLDIQEAPLPMLLGDCLLYAEQYKLSVKRPTVRQTLLDGTYAETVLAPLPCSLEVTARFCSEDAAALRETLRTALTTHIAYAFSLDGMAFSDMTVSEYRFRKSADTKFFTAELLFCGVHDGEEEPSA